ncbi:MAG: hypothetical protein ACP6IS_10370 [Candidatus Asgardarchaeia archaeon]
MQRKKVFLLCVVTFSLIVLSFVPVVICNIENQFYYDKAHSYDSSLDVKLINETIYFTESNYGKIYRVSRLINVNGINIVVTGSLNISYEQWIDSNNKSVGFPAIWEYSPETKGLDKENPEYAFYSFIPFNESKLEELHEMGLNITFRSDYNGTHFSQAIIFGKVNYTYSGYIHVLINNTIRGNIAVIVSKIVKEHHREILVINKTTESKNPSYAIYKAASFLIDHEYPFNYVAGIFLIPGNYLPNEFSKYSFVWSLSFFRLTDNNEWYSIYHFIIDPNGNFLRFNIITYNNYVRCSNENNGPITLNYSYYLLYAIIIISVVAISILFFFYITRLYRFKNNKVHSNWIAGKRSGKSQK